jgi:hypothetical protein
MWWGWGVELENSGFVMSGPKKNIDIKVLIGNAYNKRF